MSNLIKMFEIYICLSRTNLMQIYSSKIKIRSLAPWKMKLIIFNSLYSENKNSEKKFFFGIFLIETFSKGFLFKYKKFDFTGR